MPCLSVGGPRRLDPPYGSIPVHRAGREVLEPSSAVLQTAATPSQLPTRKRSRPGVRRHLACGKVADRRGVTAGAGTDVGRRPAGRPVRPRGSHTPRPLFVLVSTGPLPTFTGIDAAAGRWFA